MIFPAAKYTTSHLLEIRPVLVHDELSQCFCSWKLPTHTNLSCITHHKQMADGTEHKHTYSQFSCIGTGFSAIALGATLKQWYGISDICFFERHKQLGGAWLVNTYPGMITLSFDLLVLPLSQIDLVPLKLTCQLCRLRV